MRVAIFGGTFDPVHIGHEKVVYDALSSLEIEALFIVPTFLSPFKKSSFAPANLRLKWLKKTFIDKKIKIIDFEIKQKKSIPTIETIQYLKKRYRLKKIYLIVGADNVPLLQAWERFYELNDIVEFVVASRDNIFFSKKLKKLPINVSISSSKLRSNMDKSFLPQIVGDEILKFYKI